MLEKAREIGQHCLSGALLDPRSMNELLPGLENEAPSSEVVSDSGVLSYRTTANSRLPSRRRRMRDHGNYVICINRFAKWLGTKVEEAGITIFTGFAGASCSLTMACA